MALESTVGGASSNSYLSDEEALAYLATRWGAEAWAGASVEDREKSLIQATRDLDQAGPFQGARMAPSQSLEFPRDIQEEPGTEIPKAVREACAEQAWHVYANRAQDGLSDVQAAQADGITSESAGNASVSYGAAANSRTFWLCPRAKRLLAGWGGGACRAGRLLSDRETGGGGGSRSWPLSGWPLR